MSLQKLNLNFVGLNPILMHNNRLANPLNPYAKALKKLTGKRNKTEADHMEISRIEWEAGLYLHDGQIVIPSLNILSCLWYGAKKSKRGPKIKIGVNILEDYLPLSYQGPKIKITSASNGTSNGIPIEELDNYYSHYNYINTVVVEKKSTMRTRPIFHNWSVQAPLHFEDTIIDEDELIKVAEDAGILVGLGDWRPRFGRFMVEKV